MSTNNFAYDNILVAVSDDEAENWEDFNRGDLQMELETAIPEGYKWDGYVNDGLSRSYGGRGIFQVDVRNKEEDIYKTIIVLYRGGYYSGMNIDYVVNDEYDATSTKEAKKLDAKVEAICCKMAKIIRKYGTELIKTAQFSNGEAWYERKK